MSRPLKEGEIWTAAAVLSLPAFLLPIYNPDLFWHLSAGRWILEHHAVPREEWLSFTRAGAPWLDFEWLAQLCFEAVYRLGGLGALWLLKSLLLLGAWLPLNAALKLRGVPAAIRAEGLVLWSAAALMSADIRPDLFSLVFLALVLLVLESAQAGRLRAGAAPVAGFCLLFIVWSGLHLGFILGMAAILFYAAEAAATGRAAAARAYAALLFAALLGSVVNPYGAGPYQVAWRHWTEGAQLARHIAEWQSMPIRNPVYWGFWILLTLLAAAAGCGGEPVGAPLLFAAALGLSALRHERAGGFFGLIAVPLACRAAASQGRRGRRALGAAAALCAALVFWFSSRVLRASDGFFNYQFVPRQAAEFMARERAVFEGRRVYNPWEWGGYLGWRLSPWHKVFVDGRYIFHDELPREAAAVADFGAWRRFVAEERFDAMLLQNLPKYFPATKAYPDGSAKSFDRPYYLFFAPLDQWALVHWDDTAVLFVRRKAAPAGWLKAHEYRYARPRDQQAFGEALKRREIPAAKAAEENARHARELSELDL